MHIIVYYNVKNQTLFKHYSNIYKLDGSVVQYKIPVYNHNFAPANNN